MAARPEYDRAVFEVLHAIRDRSSVDVAREAGISDQTVRKLRWGPKYGGTRRPTHMTLDRLARVAGLAYKLVDADEADGELRALRSQIAAIEREMLRESLEREDRRERRRGKTNGEPP